MAPGVREGARAGNPPAEKCGGVGRGYEDVAGAMEIGASGEPKWREEVRRVIMTRSKDRDLDGRWGAFKRAHHEGHLGVGAGVRQDNRGQGHHRAGREFRTGRRARKMHGEGDRKTNLRKRDRKSTHLLELPVHPALKGAYAILMGLEGGGVAGA